VARNANGQVGKRNRAANRAPAPRAEWEQAQHVISKYTHGKFHSDGLREKSYKFQIGGGTVWAPHNQYFYPRRIGNLLAVPASLIASSTICPPSKSSYREPVQCVEETGGVRAARRLIQKQVKIQKYLLLKKVVVFPFLSIKRHFVVS
jgi:hypothetical protein